MPKVKEDAPERIECKYKLTWPPGLGYPGGKSVRLALEFLGAWKIEMDYIITGVKYFEYATFVSSTPITKQQIADVVDTDVFRVMRRVVVLEKRVKMLERRRWWHWFWMW